MWCIRFLVLWLAWCGFATAQLGRGAVVYTLPLGYVEGFQHTTESGFVANVYLGVPYALPPLGELRFEKPRRIANHSEERVSAKKFGPSCYPHHRDGIRANMDHSEDCLFLNVMAPAERTFSGYPVLVFIHGGGFEFGSSMDYGYKVPCENFVSQGMVFVSIEYRLGALG
ncbi:unnamed protein product [Gongylonema pulchrum]|uniref:COesterase domain-containing protein n=1 Tax=Gongylonema pulchrum TaxID=637853 RepID=A0A183DA92_9BILA|nr:unnamed protein product [Gongylonema pulchrum]